MRASLTQAAANYEEINARDVIFPWLGEQVRQRDPAGLKPVVAVMDGPGVPVGQRPGGAGEAAPGGSPGFPACHRKAVGSGPSLRRTRPTADQDGWVYLSTLTGQARELTVWFRHEANTRPLSPADRRKVEAVCGYFEKNWERMRYDEYLAAGYPIASGVIEGACRHVVKDRLERTGMHWTVAGALAMLQLRCIAINQQWDDFTAFRVRRESERLYPQTTLYEVEDWPIPQAA